MNDKDSIRTPARRRRLLASFGAPGFRPFYAYNTFAAVDMNVRIGVHGWLVLELSDDSAFWVGMFALALGVGPGGLLDGGGRYRRPLPAPQRVVD